MRKSPIRQRQMTICDKEKEIYDQVKVHKKKTGKLEPFVFFDLFDHSKQCGYVYAHKIS